MNLIFEWIGFVTVFVVALAAVMRALGLASFHINAEYHEKS